MNTPLTRREAIGLLGVLALPLGSLLAKTEESAGTAKATLPPPPAGETPPDLGNLHEMMAAIARGNPPAFSYLNPEWRDLDQWKQQARPVFHQRLSYHPTPSPTAGEFVGREDRDGLVIETWRLHVTPAYTIPLRLLLPTGRHGRLPAVVGLHCHSGKYTWGYEKIISRPDEPPVLTEFRDGAYGRPWAEVLARRGYVVAVIDAFYFGERRLRGEQLDPAQAIEGAREPVTAAQSLPPGSAAWLDATNRVSKLYEHLTAKTLFSAGATWPGITTWDDMRTVDFLVSRPEVDPARIGCAGLSGGGLRAAYLVAADPRLKAASVTGWMTEFDHQLRNHLRNHSWATYIPGLHASLDLPDAASLLAPGALLVQQCRRDRLYPMAGMQGAIDKLTKIYAKAGQPEKFRGTFYDVPHSFKPDMQDETFTWFDRWL